MSKQLISILVSQRFCVICFNIPMMLMIINKTYKLKLSQTKKKATNKNLQQQQHFSDQLSATKFALLPNGNLLVLSATLNDANKSYKCQIKNTLNSLTYFSSPAGKLFVSGKLTTIFANFDQFFKFERFA